MRFKKNFFALARDIIYAKKGTKKRKNFFKKMFDKRFWRCYTWVKETAKALRINSVALFLL